MTPYTPPNFATAQVINACTKEGLFSAYHDSQQALIRALDERDQATARAEKAEREWAQWRDAAQARMGQRAERPRPLTAREHLDAAWQAAHVPADGILPKGAEYVERYGDGSFYGPLTSGGGLRADRGVLERRLLDPPAPSRPEWEQVESLLREMPPGTVTQGSKWLVERGVRVTGAES